jgi:integrase
LPSHAGSVFFVAAPVGTEGFRYLVFDADASLHLPLTRFGRFASRRLAPTSVRCYLSALCPYFTWLRQRHRRGRTWEQPHAVARADVAEYLVAVRGCQLREHRLGFLMVQLTDDRRSYVSMFLAALRLFYAAMLSDGRYRGANPLARPIASTAALAPHAPVAGAVPQMPQISGVAAAPGSARLTDCYFVVVNERWSPKPIDDPTFPAQIFEAARKVQWRLREIIVTRMLFETGARVSEVCGLTLGDWHARGLRQEATAFNKGSGQRRVKFVRFSTNTAKLLRRLAHGSSGCGPDTLSPLHIPRCEHCTPVPAVEESRQGWAG